MLLASEQDGATRTIFDAFFHALEAALPGIYLPLYTMVTFTRMPYAKAAKRAHIQDSLVYSGLFLIAAIAIGAILWFFAI